VEQVDLINGPFNAQYGDFSGLGVVTIATRTEMPQVLNYCLPQQNKDGV
jgi:hypothetical protein